MGLCKFKYDYDDIKKRVENREDCRSIAKRMGCSTSSIYNFCKKKIIYHGQKSMILDTNLIC